MMEWMERQDGDWLVADNGKILGRVTTGIGSTVRHAEARHAEAVYAAGGAHLNSLGNYISDAAARKAVEAHVIDAGLATADVKA